MMKFSVDHLREDAFKAEGLRDYFEYRDLGIKSATDGKVMAQVIRARPGSGAKFGRHHHELEFQMVYVLKGWAKFHYEGIGEVTLTPGSCVHQPPGIRHTEIAHSDDVELIEITMPGDFKTVEA